MFPHACSKHKFTLKDDQSTQSRHQCHAVVSSQQRMCGPDIWSTTAAVNIKREEDTHWLRVGEELRVDFIDSREILHVRKENIDLDCLGEA